MNKFHKVSIAEYAKRMSNYSDREITEIHSKIVLPRRGTANSAGYDISSPAEYTVDPHDKVLIPTGIKIELGPDKVLQIYPRSSIGIKRGLMISNTVAIIDSDYYNNHDNEGHIFISLRNMTDNPVRIEAGDRIAQGVIVQYFKTDDDDAEGTREGGIGSTGK